MIKVAAFGALGLAGALLAIQIILGLEYTAGGSFGTRASMICAMVTLAALPVFIEAARIAGKRGIAAALFVAFLAFLAYSLPATTGRTGEIKETKVIAAGDVAKLRDDLERTTKMADWARQDWMTECGSGEGKKCRAKRNTVQALEDRVTKLQAEIKAAGAVTGDLGSETWAWATFGTVSAETVRRSSVLFFAVGLDMAIWSLIWLATALLTKPVRAVNDNRPVLEAEPLPPATVIPPSKVGAEIIPWANSFKRLHGRMPRLDETRSAFPEISKATAWRRLKAA